MQISENGFVFSDNKELLKLNSIHQYLSRESYWAKNIPLETLTRSIENSLCFGVYKDETQIGFARWITDKATFAWLCDVYILEAYRGLGLSKKMMSFMIFHPDLQGLRSYRLSTLDAQGLYEQFGFKALKDPDLQMEITIANPYLQSATE